MPPLITRRNPRTGHVERPWLNRDGRFVLGDPAHGAQKHHDKVAVKVATLEEAAALVGQGFSIRMTDGVTPPSLISPGALTIREIADTDPTPLWAETAPRPPFTKEAMMDELKRAMLVQANQIAHSGSAAAAAAFMGFETESAYPYCDDDPGKVDLDRFSATSYLDQAYDYAFQVGSYWRFGDDTAQDVREFVLGANPQANNGESSPLADPASCCRHAADMAYGRWALEQGYDLSVRELALLGQMTDAATRNSLSKERIVLEKGKVDADTAMIWLSQRRDFAPTRTEEGHKERWQVTSRSLFERQEFSMAFATIMRGYPIAAADLADKAEVPLPFVKELVAGRPTPDLDALQRVGRALDLDAAHFAGAAVQAALHKEGR